jgi:protein CpxP
MTMTSSNRMIALAVAALLAAPAAALAQSAQTKGPAPAAPAASAPGAGKAAPAGVVARVEQHIKELRAQLKITPAQEAQWQQFAQVMRDNAREMDEAVMQRAQQFASMSAVDDMESYAKIAEAHVQHLRKLIPAFSSLYTAMTPEQKKQADDVFRSRAEGAPQTGSGRPPG